MTFIYWGAVDSGKHHVKHFAKINGKSWCKWERDFACKYSHTDIIHKDVYKELPLDYSAGLLAKENGYVHYKDAQLRPQKTNLFVNIEWCLPCDIIFPMYSNNNCRDKLREYALEQITPNIDFFKSCTNILPYKTDLRTKIQLLLDKFGQFNKTPWGYDVVEALKHNKKVVYQYLDDYTFNIQGDTEKWLLDNNIPLTYFNMDEDKYADLFGWDIIEHDGINYENDRQITSRIPRFDTDEKQQAWKSLEVHVDEYLSQITRKDTRL